jgi:hypothetical protein
LDDKARPLPWQAGSCDPARVSAARKIGLAVQIFAAGIAGTLQAGARKEEGRALHGAGAEGVPRSASTVWERHGVTRRSHIPLRNAIVSSIN